MPSDTPEPTPPSLADQYELGDTSLDPAVHHHVEITPQTATPPRDAATGRFVAPEPAAPAHPSYLVEMAKEHGIPDSEIAELSTDSLGRMVRHLNRISGSSPARSNQPAERTTPAELPRVAPAEEPKGKFSLGLDEKEWAPETHAVFQKLEGVINDLLAKNDALTGHVQADIQEKATSQTDQGFADLGADYEHLFGKGEGLALGKDDPNFRRRLAVCKSLRDDPIQGLSIRKAVARRAAELFGDVVKAAPKADDKPAPKQHPDEAAWRDAALARPTMRTGREIPKGDAKAVQAVDQFIRDNPTLLNGTGDDPDLP